MAWDLAGVAIDSAGVVGGTELTAGRLRELSHLGKLVERDHGDVAAPVHDPKRDAASGIVGHAEIVAATARIRSAFNPWLEPGRRMAVLGGCCTLMIGLGAATRDRIGRYVENPSGLDIRARSDYVDLNYASALPGQRRTALDEPDTHRADVVPVLSRMAGLVETLGVYDLGVIIPGRHGPILVGRTWLGEYADNAEQTYSATLLDGRQIAWFFLDFNQEAIEAQDAPSNRRVEFTAKSACPRRPPASEGDELPPPRPL